MNAKEEIKRMFTKLAETSKHYYNPSLLESYLDKLIEQGDRSGAQISEYLQGYGDGYSDAIAKDGEFYDES